MIPEDVIAEIKRRVDITTVVERYVKLRRVGRSHVGLCPFHQERSPSFNVSQAEGYYHCFGCQAAGDVFSFLERVEHRSFPELVRELGEQAGVDVPEEELSPEEQERRAQRDRLKHVLNVAQVYYRSQLASADGATARAYLRDERGLSDDEIERWGIGFGGLDPQGLDPIMQRADVTFEDACLAGVMTSETRNDFFCRRITLPIRSARGDIVSFSSRALGKLAGGPKYLNGRASPLFDKSSELVGLFEALPALRRRQPAVLVEGHFDVIAMHAAGVPTALAPCGTALSPNHVEELKRRTETVMLAFDNDDAGRAATDRAALMLMRGDLEACIVLLDEGKDPDTMVRKEGRAADLRLRVENARLALDVALQEAREATASVSAKMAARDRLIPFLVAPQRAVVRDQILRAAAEALGDVDTLLEDDVKRRGAKLFAQRLSGKAPAPRPPSPTTPRTRVAPAPATTPKPTHFVAPGEWEPEEETFARALLSHPDLAARTGAFSHLIENRELRGWLARFTRIVSLATDQHAAVFRVPVDPNGRVVKLLVELQRAKQLEGGLDRDRAVAAVERFASRWR